MARLWDDTMKRLVRANPQDFVTGLLRDARFKDDSEWLKRRFAVYKDILEESWVYQETVAEGELKALAKFYSLSVA